MSSQVLREVGLKVTLPRLKVFEILDKSKEHHHTAEDVYKVLLNAGEEIGLATVYRVLTQFEASGLVSRHHFEGGQAVFELSREGHHDHMVSTKSGKVVEFYDAVIEKRQIEIAKDHGFKMTGHTMILYGEFDKE
jgi:Fur family ferric uptake transcriptional regulator